MSEPFDVVVVGAGPAGLTAGLYAARRALKTLILTKDLGGQAATTGEIENYPGIDFTDGFDLMQKFRDQAEKHGAEIRAIEVEQLATSDGLFLLKTPQDTVSARSVILAFGLTPRDLGVPGEEALKGRGVSYCVTCDGPLYKGKKVIVCGGGNHALDAAEFLSKIASEVHIVYERNQFRGAAELTKKVMDDERIQKHLGEKVATIEGEERVRRVVFESGKGLDLDGVFVEIGYVANTKWLKGFIEIDSRGQIVTDKRCRTAVPGLFAAGDIADLDYRQLVISAGEGAKAALEAYRFLNHTEGKPIIPDWGFTD